MECCTFHVPFCGSSLFRFAYPTAAGICAAVNLHAQGKLPNRGFVRQEDIVFEDFIQNRFGRYYAGSGSSSDGSAHADR